MANLLTGLRVEGMIATWTVSGGTARKLGQTEAGSKVSVKPGKVAVKTDELGETTIRSYRNGYSDALIDLRLALSTVENIALAAGAAKTTVAGPPEVISHDIDPVAGSALPTGLLHLHPKNLATSDKTRDWTFFLCEVDEEMDLEYTLAKGLYVPVRFRILPDQDATDGDVRFACYGDPATGVYYTLPGA